MTPTPAPTERKVAIPEGSDLEKIILSATYNVRTALDAENIDDAYASLLLAKSDIYRAVTEFKKGRDENVLYRDYEQVRLRLITEAVTPRPPRGQDDDDEDDDDVEV